MVTKIHILPNVYFLYCIWFLDHQFQPPYIVGQAGTIFYDSRLSDEMATGKVVRESLDRLSIIIMGGVAAEANKYGKTEGGLDDEKQLIDFFQTQIQPGTCLPFIFFFMYS